MTDAVIAAARDYWGLGEAPITLIAARENRVYRVDRTCGPAALRLHRPDYRNQAELQSELEWMAMLAGHGMHVPAPIAAHDGSYLLKTEATSVDLLTWLDGAPLSSVPATQTLYHDLGRLTAQMQNHADAWQPPADFTRPTWDLVGEDPTWGRFWENPELDARERTLLASFRDRARVQTAALQTEGIGLIHADLVPDNVLISGGQLSPIDFDDGGFGHRLFDVATITHRSRRTDPSGGLADAVIKGYGSLRPLDPATLALFEALRACSYVGWNMSRLAETGAMDRNARFISEAVSSIGRYLGQAQP